MAREIFIVSSWLLIFASISRGGVGDPQIRTDHPWYPGELAMSTFDRLFETQAELYHRVTGQKVSNDEQKALAAWLWRNTHFAHGEDGVENLFGQGFKNGNNATREYWTGLFSHGFGLCGTTHSQWCAEFEALLGHGRGRVVGVPGHNSFEVYLTGHSYGTGKWVLLDHDISTVIYSEDGSRLLSIPEIKSQLQKLTDPKFQPERQHGWLISGLHPDDAKGVYGDFLSAEYLAGYAGPPPMVHLRRGERLRRYFAPGLEDGKTFVFWGRNYNTRGVPGPERSRSWVNQPEKMHGSRQGTSHQDGQVRFANAVFTYEPNFRDGSYKEGVIAETKNSITFEFQSPYIIAATPANNDPWGIYADGCKNGLVVQGDGIAVSVSTDRGASWSAPSVLHDRLDLTDRVKGGRQFWLRFEFDDHHSIESSNLKWTTVCQSNVAVLPRLNDVESTITYQASNQSLVSAGPTTNQTKAHLVEGNAGQNRVVLELSTPRGEVVSQLFAGTHVASSNPPDPNVKYKIEYSPDHGQTWQALVRDWSIPRRGEEPPDFWSQSFCWGSTNLGMQGNSVRTRFMNDGGKLNLRSEMHLAYRVRNADRLLVTYSWSDDTTPNRMAKHVFDVREQPQSWLLSTGKSVTTHWVEMEPVAP